MKIFEYWNADREIIEETALAELQLERLRETVRQGLKTPFYSARLGDAGITSGEDIRTLDDFKRIPYTTKDDLRQAYPDGLLAVERDEVVRLHTSSGTTGTPTVIYHTQRDLDNWTELLARCIIATGARRGDVFQNMMTYGMFTGGLGLHYGAEKVGMMTIPIGGGNTVRQLQIMKDFQSTVLHITPSYMLHINAAMIAEGYSRQDFNLKKVYMGGEPYSESTRIKIEEIYGVDAYNSYGLSEMNGPGVAFECEVKNGMHIWEDAYIVEMLEPGGGKTLKDGEDGELVMTTLCREATPILRYRTGDLTSIMTGECSCGRTHRRIARIKGRVDDMLIVNGVNMYPSQIESILMKIPEVGTNYQICIDKKASIDRLTIKTEICAGIFSGNSRQLDDIRIRIREKLKAGIIVNPVVELHEPGGLPVYEGKAKRVFDNRPKE